MRTKNKDKELNHRHFIGLRLTDDKLFFYDEQEGYSSFHKKDKTVQIHLVSYMISP